MGLGLVPVQLSDTDPVNPVLRYMAGRVADVCNVGKFWVGAGLYISGAIMDDRAEIDGTKAPRHPALCYQPTIDYPDNAPPAQSVRLTAKVTRTGTVTRPFGLDIVLTVTAVPEAAATEYASAQVTETVFVTQTFSIPTSVQYGTISWHTVTEREIHMHTETTGASTTTTTRTLTVTTSVIAVTRQALTTTAITRCPDKVSGFVRITIPTEPVDIPPPTDDTQPVTSLVKRSLICDRFTSLAELRVCDSHDHDDDSPLLLITTPVSFLDAECACNALGLALADMSTQRARQDARKIIRSCFDIPGQKAWIRQLTRKSDVEVCMAISSGPRGDGPVACVQEQPVFCQ
jgi:hypothetical protein